MATEPKVRLGLPWEIAADADQILAEAARHCPQLPFTAAVDQTYAVQLPCFEDYRVVRLAPEPARPHGDELYALFAPGDFWPIDPHGRSVERINVIAPLLLSPATVLSYVRFRLSFELASLLLQGRAAAATEDSVVESIDDLRSVTGATELKNISALLGVVAAPKIERIPEQVAHGATQPAERGEGYCVAVSVVRRDATRAVAGRVRVVVAVDGTLTVLATETTWVTVSVSAMPLAKRASAIRLQPAMGISCWNTVDESSQELWRTALKDWTVDDSTAVFRTARLPFYKTFKLLEILEPLGDRYRVGYALVRRQAGDFDVRPLVGRSEIIHAVNGEPGELNVSDGTVDAYLQFFCWAIRGAEGPFRIPRAWRALPFEKAPPKPTRELLAGIDFHIHAVDDQEAQLRGYDMTRKALRRRAHVVFTQVLFQSWFEIATDGSVAMVSDEPREGLTGLPVERATSELDELVLRRHQDLTHYLLSAVEPPPVDATSTGDVAPTSRTAQECLGHLAQHGLADNQVVTDELCLHLAAGAHHHREVRFRRCRFRGPVRLQHSEVGLAMIFEQCIFEKGLHAAQAVIGATLAFIRCEFSGGRAAPDDSEVDIAANFESATISGDLTFVQCALGGRLFAPGLHVERNLRLRGCGSAPTLSAARAILKKRIAVEQLGVIDKQIDQSFFSRLAAVSLLSARIDGNFEVVAALPESAPTSGIREARLFGTPGTVASVISGRVDAHGVQVGGDLHLTGCWITGDVDCSSARVAGEFSTNSGATVWPQMRVNGGLQLHGASIGRDVDLGMSWFSQSVQLYGTTIGGGLDVFGLRTDADLMMAFSTVRGYAIAFGLRPGRDARGISLPSLMVGGALVLSGADMNVVEMRGIDVGGCIEIITGRFGRIFFTLGIEHSGGVDEAGVWLVPCRAGGFRASAITVTESVDLSGLQLKAPASASPEAGQLMLVQSRIGANLTLTTPDPRAELERRFGDPNMPWRRPPATDAASQSAAAAPTSPGPHVPAGGVTGEDNVLARHPTVADVRAMVRRDLDLRANVIDGDMDLRNVWVGSRIRLNDTTVRLDLRMDADFRLDGQRVTGLRTAACSMDLEKLICNGDVNLTGLRLLRSGGCDGADVKEIRESERGALSARGMRIKGELLFLPRKADERVDEPPRRDGGTSDYRAFVEGELDLTGVHADHLVLTGDNVDGSSHVTLERGEFGRLEIVRPLPKPIDLSDMRVERWSFGEGNGGSAGEYIEILQRMHPFDRQTWIGVETSLRNEARAGEANRVYVAMRREARAELRRRSCSRVGDRLWRELEIAWDRVKSATTGYGTQVWRPMIPVLVFAIVSMIIFRNADNVAATSDFVSALGGREFVQTLRAAKPLDPALAPTAFGRSAALAADAASTQPPLPLPSNRGAPAPPIERVCDEMEVTPVELGYQWGFFDALALTIRYQVPIVNLVTHGRWEARNSRVCAGYLTAEQYATVVQLYSWIAWPLFLILAASTVYRGAKES